MRQMHDMDPGSGWLTVTGQRMLPGILMITPSTSWSLAGKHQHNWGWSSHTAMLNYIEGSRGLLTVLTSTSATSWASTSIPPPASKQGKRCCKCFPTEWGSSLCSHQHKEDLHQLHREKLGRPRNLLHLPPPSTILGPFNRDYSIKWVSIPNHSMQITTIPVFKPFNSPSSSNTNPSVKIQYSLGSEPKWAATSVRP